MSTQQDPTMAKPPRQRAATAIKALRSMLNTAAYIPWLGRELALRCFLTPPRIPVRLPAEGEALWSLATRQDLAFGEGRLTLWHWRPTGAARGRVLLIHGWTTNSRCWLAYVSALLQAGLEVWSMDAPAHGASSGRSSDLPSFIRGLHAALDHIGEVDVLIGHSLGAASIPGTLCGSHGLGPKREVGAVVLLSSPNSPSIYTKVFSEKLGLSPRTAAGLTDAFDRRYGARETLQTTGEQLGILNAATLLVHDQGDKVIPIQEFERLSAEAEEKGARLSLHKTAGLDHAGVLIDQETIGRVVSFSLDRCGEAA